MHSKDTDGEICRVYMQKAIDSAREGIAVQDGGPFGCCIVEPRTGDILAVAHNEVLKRNNATAHAEILAITAASEKCGTWDLSGAWLYTTTECCPMCFSAAHWARISVIVFGTRIQDVADLGFHELPISNEVLNDFGGNAICLKKDVFRDECLELLHEWHALKEKDTY